MKIRSLTYAVLAAPLLLTACGDGYEMIKTDTMFPYGNQRTAGSGVAYVLAKMAPAKDVVLAPPEAPKTTVIEETKQIVETKPEPAPEPAPAPVEPQPMDKVFTDSIDK